MGRIAKNHKYTLSYKYPFFVNFDEIVVEYRSFVICDCIDVPNTPSVSDAHETSLQFPNHLSDGFLLWFSSVTVLCCFYRK